MADQHFTVPPLIAAQASSMPLASSCVTPFRPFTRTGVLLPYPPEFMPQHFTVPPERSAQENDQPAATSIAFVIPATVTGPRCSSSFRRRAGLHCCRPST